MKKPIQVRLAGTGGQGAILAGILLAEASVLDNHNVIQTQSYGPEARGGASRSEVLISDEEILHPRVIQADFTVCLSQEACDTYGGKMRKSGLLIIDSDHVTRAPTIRAVSVPLARIAQEVTGRKVVANVVGLGVLIGLTGIVSSESAEAAIRARAPKGTAEINLKALKAGYELAKRIVGEGA